jgi:hypothetical protein
MCLAVLPLTTRLRELMRDLYPSPNAPGCGGHLVLRADVLADLRVGGAATHAKGGPRTCRDRPSLIR